MSTALSFEKQMSMKWAKNVDLWLKAIKLHDIEIKLQMRQCFENRTKEIEQSSFGKSKDSKSFWKTNFNEMSQKSGFLYRMDA